MYLSLKRSNLDWMGSGNVETPLSFAVYFLYFICGVTVLGLILLLALKLRHIAADKQEKTCLEKYKDYFIYLQAYGEEEERLKLPPGNLTRREKQIIQKKLFELLERFTGIHRQKLIVLCVDMGLEELDLNRMNSWWKWTKIDAAFNLGMMRSGKAVEGLLHLLKKSDFDSTIFIIARAIAKCARSEKDLRQMVELLAAHRKNCHQLIVDILGDSHLDTGPLLVSFLKEEDADLIKIGLIGLSSHAQPNMDPILHELVDSADKEVRIKVVKLLCRDVRYLTDKNVNLFMTHPDWELRSIMAKAIGALGLSQYIPLLKRAVKDPHWWVAHNSTNSLAQLQVEGFMALCAIMEEEKDSRVREMAHQVVQKELERGKHNLVDLDQQISYNQKLYFYQKWNRKSMKTVHALEK